MPTKEEIERINYLYSGKSAWDELAEAADNGELIDLSKNLLSAYKESIEALEMLYDYSRRDLTVEELEQVKDVIDKSPVDL